MASSAHHGRQIRNEAAMAIVIGKRAMIAMQLTSPDLSPRQTPSCSTAANAQQGECPAVLPVAETAIVTTQFIPLDPGIVSESIPAFFIGRNKEGFWVARDARGRIGGIFLLANSALSFAKRNSRPTGCATIFPSERFELDLENSGNPLVAQLGPLMRLTMRPRQRMIALADRIMKPLQRWLKDHHLI
jgi:hypothetical protein